MKKIVTLAALLSVSAAIPALAMDKDHHPQVDHYLKMMDKNGDGVVNQSEHHAFTHKMFRELDSNNDQLISRKELESHKHGFHKEHASDHPHHKRYDAMSPSAGRDHTPRFGSRSDRAYSSYKETVEYDGMTEEGHHQHQHKSYNKNYRKY